MQIIRLAICDIPRDSAMAMRYCRRAIHANVSRRQMAGFCIGEDSCRNASRNRRSIVTVRGHPGCLNQTRKSNPLVTVPTVVKQFRQPSLRPLTARCEPRRKKGLCTAEALYYLAETEGFEPSMRLYTPYSLSRGAPSATRSRFQILDYA